MFLATVKPKEIVVRYQSERRPVTQSILDSQIKRWDNKQCVSLDNLKKQKTSYSLSHQSKKKILDSVNFLNSVSKARTISLPGGKFIYNFKSSFITLTLPSQQIHSDVEIKKLLNNFLNRLRQVYGLKNYIWKAELQKNDNIHFHLIIDKFIYYKALRYYWNQSLELLGYISDYQKKFKNLSLQEYADQRGISKQNAIRGYRYGKKTNWKQPPTENVITIQNSQQLGYYIAKYITKSVQEVNDVNNDNEARVVNFGKVWSRSQSLSKIKFITRYDWEDLRKYLTEKYPEFKKMKVKVFDWCTKYFLTKELSKSKLKRWFTLKMHELGITYDYVFP